jgi:hypothetical protein
MDDRVETRERRPARVEIGDVERRRTVGLLKISETEVPVVPAAGARRPGRFGRRRR